MFGPTRRLAIAAGVAALALAVPLSLTTLAGTATAAATAPSKSGVLILGATSGSITGTLKLSITPVAGAGQQICDPANESFGVVYASAPGNENGVAGEAVNYTVLAPADGSLIPAGGTLTKFLPSATDPVFPATGGVPELDSSTAGTFSLGVRCQDSTSTQVFQNYWTTITVKNGGWKLGGGSPTTSVVTTTSSGTTTSRTSATSTGPSGPVKAGSLTISPGSGRLLAGTYTLAGKPMTAGASQVCGDVQSFAVLYFSPPGREFDPVGGQVAIKARPVQAGGLDVPIGGSLVDFLATAGGIDFSQSLGADSWQQPLTAGKYSLGVRCQSGLADQPTIYQNYFSTVDVAADGSWRAAGAPGSTSTSPTATTTDPPGRTLTLSVADAAGHLLRAPVTVAPDQRLFVSAEGFQSSENVAIAVHSASVTLANVAAVNGGIAAEITIPRTLAAGPHTLTFTGATSGRIGTLRLTVGAAAVITRTSTTSSSTTALTTSHSVAGTSSTATTSTTSAYQQSSTPNPFVPNNNSGGPSGSLAYTGFPFDDCVTAAALLLGFGIVVLALSVGRGAPPRRARQH